MHKHRKTQQLCVGGLMCAESIHGLTFPQCLCRPFPLPAEETCGHVVGGHIHYILKPKKNLLEGLETASIQPQIVYGWCTSSGPKQPDGNEHYPRQQQTWAALSCSAAS